MGTKRTARGRMKRLIFSAPDLLAFVVAQEVARRNKRDGTDKWTVSNVLCADLGERYGVECPTTPIPTT